MEMAKVTSKGQITIPVSIRRRLNINEGDKILFIDSPEGIIMVNPDMLTGTRGVMSPESGVRNPEFPGEYAPGISARSSSVAEIALPENKETITETAKIKDRVATKINAPTKKATTTDNANPTAAAPDIAAPDIAAPDIATPDIATPDMAAPDMAAPDMAAPDIAAPDMAAPDIAAPDIAAPDMAAPDIAAPDMAAPDMAAPDIAAPDMAAPDIAAPDALMNDVATTYVIVSDTTATNSAAEDKTQHMAESDVIMSDDEQSATTQPNVAGFSVTGSDTTQPYGSDFYATQPSAAAFSNAHPDVAEFSIIQPDPSELYATEASVSGITEHYNTQPYTTESSSDLGSETQPVNESKKPPSRVHGFDINALLDEIRTIGSKI